VAAAPVAQQPVDPWPVVVTHLRENLAAGQLTLLPQVLAELDGVAAAAVEEKC